MEVRCGKCNKLFRVSDDKITGTGIKFPCTRCGTYVKITREDFEQYTVSLGAVSVSDQFEPMPMPVKVSVPPDAAGPIASETAPPEQGSQPFDFSAQATHENVSEEKPPLFVEPDRLPSATAPKTEPAVELKPEPLMLSKPKTPPPDAAAPKAEPAVELKPEPLMQPKPTAPPPVEPQPKPKLEPLFVPKQKAKPAPERETPPEPVRPAPPVSHPPAPPVKPPVQPTMPRKESARPAAPAVSPAAEKIMGGPVPSSMPSHAGRMILILVVTLIIAGLAAYGIYVHLQEAPPSPLPMKGRREAPREIVSNEGLQIVNLDGSVQANGDLFITGAVQNTTEKERTAWYVVAEVTNSQGAVISRLRLLNGNQIYTRSDYEIMAGRGVNVQELKAKNVQEKGVVIPPRGTVGFELRYLQAPAGIASFVAQALPFEPAQLQKEIAEEMK